MRPWQHAVSTGRSGRPWELDLEIHEFLDMTKAACADRRHRLVLHSVDFGLAVTRLAFQDRSDVDAIVRCHVIEDLGAPVTLSEWLAGCAPDQMPRPLRRRLAVGKAGIVALVGGRLHPACHASIDRVYDFLTLPVQFAPDHPAAAYAVLMNSFGPALARRIFGPPRRIDHALGQATVDWAWIAEAIVYTMIGRIPDLGEIVRACQIEPVSPPAQRMG